MKALLLWLLTFCLTVYCSAYLACRVMVEMFPALLRASEVRQMAPAAFH